MIISIAMATFNGANFVHEQLESFLIQNRLPDELIICDDGSEDNTISIIENFIERAPFSVKLIKNTINLGYVKNFEKALALCSGDLIFFSDQDDVWFPEKIEFIEQVFRSNRERLLLIHDGKLVDERLCWYGATKLGQVRAGWGDDKHFVTGALTVMHKDLRNCLLPFPINITVGHDGWMHLIARFMEVRGVIDKPLQLIRRHSSNTSSWVGSATHQISSISVIQSNLKTKAATSYQNRFDLNSNLHIRLSEIRRNHKYQFYFDRIDTSLEYLKAERKAIEARACILKAGFLGRKYQALRMLLRNEYIYFNGLMSFLRDFSR